MPLRPVQLRLLPLAVGAILIATAIPVALRAPVIGDGGFGFGDLVANVMLFAPLGVALRRRAAWFVFIAAAFFSAAIEVSQMWSVGRFASPYDVAANAFGALIAAHASRAAQRRGLLEAQGFRVGPRTVTALLTLAAAAIAVWQAPHPSSAVAGWDRNYPLLLGNEHTGDREWHGTIAALGIWPRALAPRELQGAGSREFRASGAVYVTHQPLIFAGGPAVRLSDDVAQAFVAAATDANAFAIAARIRTADVRQRGPARILSFSIDPLHRNVDLGQRGEKLVFRVRTDVSGPNGSDYYAESDRILKADEETLVLASYDGAIARVYVDAMPVARTNLAASGCAWPALCDVDAPGVWASLAAVVTLLGISVFGWRSRVATWLAAVLAVGVVLALGILHPDPVHRPWEGWIPVFIMFGAVTTALSVCVSAR